MLLTLTQPKRKGARKRHQELHGSRSSPSESESSAGYGGVIAGVARRGSARVSLERKVTARGFESRLLPQITRIMAVEAVLLLILMSVSLGNTHSEMLKLECQPAVGVVGQTTKISCSFKKNFEEDQIIITAGSVTKRGQADPLFWFQNDKVNGDHRFKSPSKNDPFLLLTDTAVSDEGEYDYTVVTNRGIIKDRTFGISVTAKYNPPSISTWPEKIEEGSPAELNCNVSGGYPAGAIHWFDNTNTNWTKSATLEVKEREDKLLHLSSKLTFAKIDSSWVPFRCVVLNSKFIQEGETTFHLRFTGNGDHTDHSGTKWGSITTGLLVIGLIIVGLLLALLYCRRHVQQARRPSTQPILRGFPGRTRQAEAEAEAEAEADTDADEADNPLKPNGDAEMKT
ncbi:hypothetical protein AOLI_G00004370 [Acnodon oligacanthus]